jgi:hypothetical protein
MLSLLREIGSQHSIISYISIVLVSFISLIFFLAYQGFKDVSVNMKEESKDVIKQWLPGSGAEDYVVSAEINAKR